MELQTQPLSEHFGLEVQGVDLAEYQRHDKQSQHLDGDLDGDRTWRICKRNWRWQRSRRRRARE